MEFKLAFWVFMIAATVILAYGLRVMLRNVHAVEITPRHSNRRLNESVSSQASPRG